MTCARRGTELAASARVRLTFVLLLLAACDSSSQATADAASTSTALDASVAADAGPIPVFTVTMAPDGDDANDGISRPVQTLVRVQAILREHKPAGDVEIRIHQGTYVAPPFHDWRFYVPGHTISFLPIDYQVGGGLPAGGLPVFRNAKCGTIYCDGFWLQPRLPRETSDP